MTPDTFKLQNSEIKFLNKGINIDQNYIPGV